MDTKSAKAILSNLRERIEPDQGGRYRLEGVITRRELEALDFLLDPAASGVEEGATATLDVPAPAKAPLAASAIAHDEEEVQLDLSTLALPDRDQGYRVCLDFGTAMSKATYIRDKEDEDYEEIQVLRLGVPGNQEEIDEFMLVSSLFIDAHGLVWFGQSAIEQEHAAGDGANTRVDNIKRWLSEGNLSTKVDPKHNPTSHEITYEDLVLAYLAFFTWAVNAALKELNDGAGVPSNFRRRFAMPCFPRASAKQVEQKLKTLLGEAQVIADTFQDEIHQGLRLGRFLSVARQLRVGKYSYPFVGDSVTEPLGVAGSLLSWRSSYDALALIVDIGAGTSDFGLFRMRVTVDEDGEIEEGQTIALEVDGSARGITEAGNHLDQILKAFILGRAGIDATHPRFINIAYDLERNIRDYKETLFNTGSAYIVLYNDETVEVSLDEFLGHDAVQKFEESLRRTMIEILESVDTEFIDWVRVNPARNLIVVLTGGGAALPMARKLVAGPVAVRGSSVMVAPAQAFPVWLQKDHPGLEDHYSRIAVSLGGARRNVIKSKGVAKTTGSGLGGHVLDRFPTRGT